MHKLILAGALFGAVGTLVGAVQTTGWSQNATTSRVTVDYTLTGSEPMVVTLDVCTNGVSIGAENLSHVSGDANQVVQPSDATRTITWRPDHAWAGHLFTNGEITVKAVAWSLKDPPDYMAVCLSATNTLGVADTVRYYVAEGALPGGIGADCWRGEWLLMRRIHAAGQTFVMGSPEGEQYRCATLNSGPHERWGSVTEHPEGLGYLPETPHSVSFTKDFYIGVFIFTYQNNDYISTSDACAWANRFKPLTGVSWNSVRGKDSSGSAPLADSYLGRLRALTGLDFDLPTEAQWEFACRSGTSTPFGDGLEVPADYYYSKSGSFGGRAMAWCCNWADFNTQNDVGRLKPNLWGLYDMHGSCHEWCYDWVDGNPLSTTPVTDPVGLDSGTYKVMRGVSHTLWIPMGRSATRIGVTPTQTNDIGFRPVCPL